MKIHRNKIVHLALAVLLFGTTLLGVVEHTRTANAVSTTASFSLSPASGSFEKGSEQSISIFVNLDNDYNAAWSDLYFDSSKFQYLGTTIGSSFNGGGNASVQSNGYGSYVSISATRNSGGPLHGSYVLATIKFKMTATGGAYGNFGYKRVVLFPTTEYNTSATNGSYTVTNPPTTTPPTTTPPPNPTPTPTPTPSPTPTPTPTATKKPAPKASAPAQSTASKTGLQISDFAISGLDYTTAVLTWKTNKAASTKVNFSTSKSDLYIERKLDGQTTEHSITLQAPDLHAGNHYYLRITSDDGSGPVTIDGDFTTKYIPITIKATDVDNNPVSDATVTIYDQVNVTDKNGEATFDVSDGDVTISANKGDLSAYVSTTVDVPQKDDPQQKITLTLTKGTSQPAQPQTNGTSGGSVVRVVLAILVLLAGIGTGLFIFLRRKVNAANTGDPLEAEQYAPPVSPPELPPVEKPATPQKHTFTPLPLPIDQPAHHASIGEMVKQQQAGNGRSGEQAAAGAEQISPAGQHIPKHTSLKDMVAVPEPTVNDDEPPRSDDLPIGPTHEANTKRHVSDDADEPADILEIKH